MRGPKVLITIDTEVGERAGSERSGFENFVLGSFQGTEYGTPLIARLLEERSFQGEFFVDVYEEDAFVGKFPGLCDSLSRRGHGVQLHTHPGFSRDRNRIFMHQYSLAEQTEIIKMGMERIVKWSGKPPIAHRAGGYGANADTLTALKHNRIFIDSSYYAGHPNCRLMLPTLNEAIVHEEVLEIPVSITDGAIKRWINGLLNHSSRKFDINSMTPAKALRLLRAYKAPYLVLFLHSSSFLKRDPTGKGIENVDQNAIDVFQTLLDQLRREGREVVGFSEFTRGSSSEGLMPSTSRPGPSA